MQATFAFTLRALVSADRALEKKGRKVGIGQKKQGESEDPKPVVISL